MYAQAILHEVHGLKKLILTVVITAAFTAVITAVAARHHYGEDSEDKHVAVRVLHSRVLGEQRELLVYLPESYERERTRRYPVLYVLDGSSQSGHTAGSARLMARIGVMPEVIVVGVPASDENRHRDYTPPYMRMDADGESRAPGKADRFLNFFEAELIPHIDQNYRTSSLRMLAGNSRGGLFVVYSLMEAPDLFSARFAYSPALWRENERIVSELAKSLETRRVPPTFLYLSLGDLENEKMNRAFGKVTALLRMSARPGLRWRADLTTGANHQDNAVLSTPVGFQAYFAASAAQAENLGVRPGDPLSRGADTAARTRSH